MHQKENAQPRNAELSARKNSANPTTTASAAIVLTAGDMPRVDSRVLAQRMTVGQMLTAQAAACAGDHKTAYARIKTAMHSLQTLLPMNGGV